MALTKHIVKCLVCYFSYCITQAQHKAEFFVTRVLQLLFKGLWKDVFPSCCGFNCDSNIRRLEMILGRGGYQLPEEPLNKPIS